MTDIINNLSNKKRVFIKTYGCQMNVYDSERMTDALSGEGYEPTNDINEADLVLLNTCHIREKAAEKVYSELGRIRDMRNEREPDAKKMLIGVAGCVAQAEGDEIMRRAPAVDLVFGPQSYHRLPQMVEKAHTTRVIDTDFTNEDKFDHLPLPSREVTMKRGLTAFLTVQEGCDKFCSFCVVPYTRGAEVSRPVSQVLQEARALAAGGVREVTLLGQNVNAYHGLNEHGRSVSLGELCYMLAEIDGIDRIRYTTSHPRDMDEGLIEAHRNLDKLMPFLHLPVQSGSDAMLKAMNRRHTRAEYIEIIERIKDARPDMSLSSDFIIGFPGETDRDFQDTVDLVKQIGYSAAYSFKYSMRPGTPGAEMTNQIEEHVKTERLEILQAVIQEEQDKFNLSCVGKTLSVLLEKPGKLVGQIAGRSPYLQPIHLEADAALIGQIRPVTIISAKRGSIHGRLA